MTHKTPGIRLATTAIAAVLALSSTQLLAQTTTAVPGSPPAVTIPSEPLTTSASDPLAPESTFVRPKASKSTTTKRAASAARPAKTAAPAARTPVTAPVDTPVSAAAKPVEATLGPVAAAELAPPPPVQVAAPVVTPRPAGGSLLPIAAALGFGLLGMIVVGLALRRRRRRNDEEFAAEQEPMIDEAPAELDPLLAKRAVVATAALAAPAEFLPAGAEAAPALTPSDCVDAAPGSHVEAACDGPTEDNPSLSLKKRLKRAHFFDEREQLAAAGLAVPVAADAGLPDAVVVPEPAPSGREPV
jgi:hypothetical protein